MNCWHTDDECAFLCTWTSIELSKAILKDYRVVEVIEIYNFEQIAKIFGKYVNTFLKIKQECRRVLKQCFDASREVVDKSWTNWKCKIRLNSGVTNNCKGIVECFVGKIEIAKW